MNIAGTNYKITFNSREVAAAGEIKALKSELAKSQRNHRALAEASIRIHAEVQTENADLKAALSAWENEALQSRASMELMEKGLDERDELKAKLAQAEETADHFLGRAEEFAAKLAQVHKDYGCELLDPNGTIWDHAAQVQKENAELRSNNERLRTHLAGLQRQIRKGELVPLDDAYIMTLEAADEDERIVTRARIQQYAAERQKEGAE